MALSLNDDERKFNFYKADGIFGMHSVVELRDWIKRNQTWNTRELDGPSPPPSPYRSSGLVQKALCVAEKPVPESLCTFDRSLETTMNLSVPACARVSSDDFSYGLGP
jgi:hypothetical protein